MASHLIGISINSPMSYNLHRDNPLLTSPPPQIRFYEILIFVFCLQIFDVSWVDYKDHRELPYRFHSDSSSQKSVFNCRRSSLNDGVSYSSAARVMGKKRKGDNQAEEPQLKGEAMATFVGVSSVVWPDDDVIYSC